MSHQEKPEPLLIEPARLPPRPLLDRRAVLIGGATALTMLVPGGLFALGAFDPAGGAFEATAVRPPHGMLMPLNERDPNILARAIAGLRLDPGLKQLVRADVVDRRLRVGLIAVWDWADEDGDVVAIVSAGYEQHVPLAHRPSVVVLPYADDPSIMVTAIQDGKGGITVGITSAHGPMPLARLMVGQSMRVVVR
jgi:hypothetical protein